MEGFFQCLKLHYLFLMMYAISEPKAIIRDKASYMLIASPPLRERKAFLPTASDRLYHMSVKFFYQSTQAFGTDAFLFFHSLCSYE